MLTNREQWNLEEMGLSDRKSDHWRHMLEEDTGLLAPFYFLLHCCHQVMSFPCWVPPWCTASTPGHNCVPTNYGLKPPKLNHDESFLYKTQLISSICYTNTILTSIEVKVRPLFTQGTHLCCGALSLHYLYCYLGLGAFFILISSVSPHTLLSLKLDR